MKRRRRTDHRGSVQSLAWERLTRLLANPHHTREGAGQKQGVRLPFGWIWHLGLHIRDGAAAGRDRSRKMLIEKAARSDK